MKNTFRIIPLLFVALVAGCSQVTNAIDSFLTFNDERTFDLPFPKLTPVGVALPASFPLSPDSATLAKNKTGLSLLKTAKLTKLTFTFSDPTYTMQSVDTMYLQVTNPTLGVVDLASYSHSVDSMRMTNNDFGKFVKDTGSHFIVTFKLLAAPNSDIVAHSDAVITYTASPL